ncbi:hypothetical protein F5Y08DRAFT_268485 [Xylaria arbuscula]|uniref:Uncharacterized protein n=1 Tax=Xylaria arbuscula TaxID=114810 RepID=A0A9W8TNV1_9PEZI|nr:hypothetical protein F5Y08DRAFT_268485 [Xylaria arbuscula]KAJ3578242.1 hypothetical protein NPX13_g2320 [Xylaria arbuscula]
MAAKTCSPRAQELHVALLTTTAYNLPSCSRALTIIDDFAEEAASASARSPTTPENEELVSICRSYKRVYRAFVRNLVKKSAEKEREIYERAKATSAKRKRGSESESTDEEEEKDGVWKYNSRQKRRGRVFAVDKGEHIAAALETLRLEEFLKEREQQKHVHFSE